MLLYVLLPTKLPSLSIKIENKRIGTVHRVIKPTTTKPSSICKTATIKPSSICRILCSHSGRDDHNILWKPRSSISSTRKERTGSNAGLIKSGIPIRLGKLSRNHPKQSCSDQDILCTGWNWLCGAAIAKGLSESNAGLIKSGIPIRLGKLSRNDPTWSCSDQDLLCRLSPLRRRSHNKQEHSTNNWFCTLWFKPRWTSSLSYSSASLPLL